MANIDPGAKAEFDLGRVISRTFSAIKNNFMTFFLASLIVIGIPYFLISLWPIFTGLYSGGLMDNPDAFSELIGPFIVIAVITGLVMMVCSFILQGAIVHASFQDYNGERVSFGESIRVALRFFWPIVGFSILAGLGMMLGFIALIIPGIILALMWSVGVPALIVEKTGVSGAFSRSSELTRGYRWWILLLIIIFIVISAVIGAVGAVVMLIFGAPDQQTIMLQGASTFGLLVSAVINTLVQMFSVIVSASGVAALYYELRHLKEGITPQSLASVFD